jgi:hypothetical protein
MAIMARSHRTGERLQLSGSFAAVLPPSLVFAEAAQDTAQNRLKIA